ncbi:hypothetical protein BKA60DRAFT_567682 [Fusarium oxysporum]|nr:hypothetical protein BKA60DRAFT_567682 [Fusarium oxysporum]
MDSPEQSLSRLLRPRIPMRLALSLQALVVHMSPNIVHILDQAILISPSRSQRLSPLTGTRELLSSRHLLQMSTRRLHSLPLRSILAQAISMLLSTDLTQVLELSLCLLRLGPLLLQVASPEQLSLRLLNQKPLAPIQQLLCLLVPTSLTSPCSDLIRALM